MMEWIQGNWISIVGAVAAFGGGLYVPFIRGLVITGLKSLVTEVVLRKIAIQVVGKVVKSSKNKLDDIWFAQFKKNVEDA